MIKVEFFTYTDEQWNAIREQVLDDLGVDVDTITHQVTSRLGKYSHTGTLSVRDRIELAVSKYHSFNCVQSPSRAELDALRKDAEKLRARIIMRWPYRLSVQANTTTLPLQFRDPASMPTW